MLADGVGFGTEPGGVDPSLGNSALPKCIADGVLLSGTSGDVYYTSREACARALPDEADGERVLSSLSRYRELSDKASQGFSAMSQEERTELGTL